MFHSNHVVKLEETAVRINACKAALLEAQGLIRQYGISRRELKQMAAGVSRDRSAKEPRVDEVLALMKLAGLTIADLADAPAKTRRYRHPVAGEAWDGRGGQPAWLKRALLVEGYRPKELRVA